MITVTFELTDDQAKTTIRFLRRKYNNSENASLNQLAKFSLLRDAAGQAEIDLKDMYSGMDEALGV